MAATAGVFAAFALLHLTLFISRPRLLENLYFAVFTGALMLVLLSELWMNSLSDLAAMQVAFNVEMTFLLVMVVAALILEHEREAREQEIAQRVLEADNQRKTAELEEARRLQLAMLPDSVPEMKSFEFAVHMATASEVGGDYYDFLRDHNGTWMVALGDATGHGLHAGMVVGVANRDGEPFGYERVRQTFADSGALDPESAVARLVETADAYRSGEAITDDVTLVVLRARGDLT